MNSIDEQFIQEAEVHPPSPQQEEDDGKFVLETQKDPDAKVLKAKQDRECHPEDGGKQAAAEIQQEPNESIHPSGLQIDVEVVVLGAHQVSGPYRATGRMQACRVGAVERTDPAGNGDYRHQAPLSSQSPRAGFAVTISGIIHEYGTDPATYECKYSAEFPGRNRPAGRNRRKIHLKKPPKTPRGKGGSSPAWLLLSAALPRCTHSLAWGNIFVDGHVEHHFFPLLPN